MIYSCCGVVESVKVEGRGALSRFIMEEIDGDVCGLG